MNQEDNDFVEEKIENNAETAIVAETANGDGAEIDASAAGNAAVIRDEENAEIARAEEGERRAEWRQEERDSSMETDSDLPVTPGRSPVRKIDKTMERAAMLQKALEPVAPEERLVQEGICQLEMGKDAEADTHGRRKEARHRSRRHEDGRGEERQHDHYVDSA